jgi:hypothetical protein
MNGWIKTVSLSIALICFSSCYESRHVDFHSYQELSEYSFISAGWIPEVMGLDACAIQETYDVNNNHLFGKFDFKNRPIYDSIFKTCVAVGEDSLLAQIEQINKPRCPKWFIPKERLIKRNYLMVKQQNFYLMMDRKRNIMYYLR